VAPEVPELVEGVEGVEVGNWQIGSMLFMGGFYGIFGKEAVVW
jgi:hypothetical protein